MERLYAQEVETTKAYMMSAQGTSQQIFTQEKTYWQDQYTEQHYTLLGTFLAHSYFPDEDLIESVQILEKGPMHGTHEFFYTTKGMFTLAEVAAMLECAEEQIPLLLQNQHLKQKNGLYIGASILTLSLQLQETAKEQGSIHPILKNGCEIVRGQGLEVGMMQTEKVGRPEAWLFWLEGPAMMSYRDWKFCTKDAAIAQVNAWLGNLGFALHQGKIVPF